MEKLPQNYRCKLRHSVFFEQKEATKRNRPRRCGAKGRFFKEKAPQKPFAEGCCGPHQEYGRPVFCLPPNPLSRAIQVIFGGAFRARKESPPGPRETRAKESLLSFARIFLGLEEKPKLLLKK